MNEKMVIFIATPDTYEDVLLIFLKCFRKFWKDCPYEVVISTNTKEYKGVTTYKNYLTNDGWMDRAIPVLKQIEAEYILLLCDDLIITEKVDSDRIKQVFRDVIDYKIDFCGLTSHSSRVGGKKLYSNSDVLYVRRNRPYALNLQAGIYRRKFLIELLGDGSENPWELERKWIKEANNADNSYFLNIAVAEGDILNCRNGVLKGKWYGSVLRKLKRLNIEVEPVRPVIGRLQELWIFLSRRISIILPTGLRPIIKKCLSFLGIKFATEY